MKCDVGMREAHALGLGIESSAGAGVGSSSNLGSLAQTQNGLARAQIGSSAVRLGSALPRLGVRLAQTQISCNSRLRRMWVSASVGWMQGWQIGYSLA